MGNCMVFHSQPKKQARATLDEERETEVDTSVPVEKMSSASCERYKLVSMKLQNGEFHHLAPFMRQSGKLLVPCRITDNRNLKIKNVKIVVTLEQLELMLSGSMKFQSKRRVARVRQSSGLRGCPKWLPSLPTIEEVQNC